LDHYLYVICVNDIFKTPGDPLNAHKAVTMRVKHKNESQQKSDSTEMNHNKCLIQLKRNVKKV